MKKRRFKELLANVREAVAIHRGEKYAASEYIVHTVEAPDLCREDTRTVRNNPDGTTTEVTERWIYKPTKEQR